MDNEMKLSSLGTAELILLYNISVGIMEAERNGLKIEDVVETFEKELSKRDLSSYAEAV